MSKKYPGWNIEALEKQKAWATAMVHSLNMCLIYAGIEPIEVIPPKHWSEDLRLKKKD